MTLTLYDTLSRAKRPFVPIDRSRVGLYVCGPTVYDEAHIGNARPIVVFDVLFRLLRHLYGAAHVRYVRNLTDVDDKINARAAARGVPIDEVTAQTIGAFAEDVAALGCLPPTVEPRATRHIGEMLDIIGRLLAGGHAYVAEGHVLFAVPSMPDYGALSRRPLDEMIAGARVEVAPYKLSDADFVLWKPSGVDEPGWDSPWGRGRPGWHIECSAMSWRHLGERFDIHGGGIDLVFPHHENEIAQTRCAFGVPAMANYWMHNGFLQVEGRKMSKSEGNFTTIRQVLADWPGETVRHAMLRTHYRQPIDWTFRALDESDGILRRFRQRLTGTPIDCAATPAATVLAALSDDLNTPLALHGLHQLFSSSRAGLMQAGDMAGWDVSRPESASVAVASARVFGLLAEEAPLQADPPELAAAVEAVLAERLAARSRKDWAESDRLRDKLSAMGIALKDGKAGTTWERAPRAAPPGAAR